MSLVNDMLNDLDKRRSEKARDDVNIDWMTGQKNATKNRFFMPLLSLGSLVVFVGVGIGIWANLDRGDIEAMAYLEKNNSDMLAKEAPPSTVLASKINKEQGEQHSLASAGNVALQENPLEQGHLLIEATTAGAAPKLSDVALRDSEPAQKNAPEPKNNPENTGAGETFEPSPAATATATKNQMLAATKTNKSAAKAAQTVKTVPVLSPVQRDRSVARQAESLIRNRQSTQAEKILISEMASNSNASNSAAVLASLWVSQKNFDEAQKLLSRQLYQNPGAIDLIKVQARLYLLTSQAGKALELLMTVSPPMDAHADYYEMLGLSARQEQQYELSVQAYKNLLEYDSSRGDWWVGMAIALDLQGANRPAKAAYRSALESRKLEQTLRRYAQQRVVEL